MRNPRLHQHRRCPTVRSRCLGRRRRYRPCRRPSEGRPVISPISPNYVNRFIIPSLIICPQIH